MPSVKLNQGAEKLLRDTQIAVLREQLEGVNSDILFAARNLARCASTGRNNGFYRNLESLVDSVARYDQFQDRLSHLVSGESK